MFRYSLLVAVLVVPSVYCAFFDLTDVDDPLSLLWNTKESTFAPTCNAISDSGLSRGGLCKPRSQCLLSGGRLYGAKECGFFKSCCVTTRKCSKRTKAKVSYFTNNVDFDANIDECTFTVETFSNNVCQMRVDFEKFQFYPSDRITTDLKGFDHAGVETPLQTQDCTSNYLTITPQNYNIPRKFCGNNDGQHVYIHLHSSREAQFYINLSHRQGTSSLQSINWQLKITQLECPGPVDFFSKFKNADVGADFKLLAPEGAIQYFRAPSGRFRSFGLDGSTDATDNYISDLNYAIAFRKGPLDTCVEFTPKYMKFRNDECHDYLYVPNLNISTADGTETAPKICPTDTATIKSFSAKNVPGFLLVYVVSAKLFVADIGPGSAIGGLTTPTEPFAFDIHYQTTASC